LCRGALQIFQSPRVPLFPHQQEQRSSEDSRGQQQHEAQLGGQSAARDPKPSRPKNSEMRISVLKVTPPPNSALDRSAQERASADGSPPAPAERITVPSACTVRRSRLCGGSVSYVSTCGGRSIGRQF
jgi:hypothetical protein